MKKKSLLLLLIAAYSISVTACGGKDNSDKSDKSESSSMISTTQSAAGESTSENSSGASSSDSQPANSVELLDKVWGAYGEDDKFSVSGGDATVANMKGPGKYSMEDSQAVDSALGFPAAEAGKVEDAASLMHMMNANTFTCGAFHIKNENDITELAVAVKDNIMKRQWMCGFPDKLVVIKVDSYIVEAFGEEEIINTFKTNVSKAYPDATVISEEPIL